VHYFERSSHLAYWFFFSSRRRHTRFSRDWSSDVCSSDLGHHQPVELALQHPARRATARIAKQHEGRREQDSASQRPRDMQLAPRSEERRVGKECRSRRSPYHLETKTKAMQQDIRGTMKKD